MMKKMGWGFGLAAALALIAGQAHAQSAPSGNSTYSGGSTAGSTGTSRDSSTGSMGSSTDQDTTGKSKSSSGASDSAGTTGSGSTSGSMGTGSGSTSGSMGTGSGSTSSNDSTAQPSGHLDSLQGKVQKFDRSKNTLTLSGNPQPLKVDSSTKVMKDGSRASLDDIKEGDQVRASYSGSGDVPNVTIIDITSAGAAGKKQHKSGSTGSSTGTTDSSGTQSDSTTK